MLHFPVVVASQVTRAGKGREVLLWLTVSGHFCPWWQGRCPLNLGSSYHSKSGSGESTGPKARVNLQGPVWGSPLFSELDLPLKHSTATPRGRAFKRRNRGKEDSSHSQVCICLCACTCACMRISLKTPES